MKKKNKNLGLAFLVVFSLIAVIVLVVSFTGDGGDRPPDSIVLNRGSMNVKVLSIASQQGEQRVEYLDFCSNVQQCIDHLMSTGMPSNYLQVEGILISCDNGICKATK